MSNPIYRITVEVIGDENPNHILSETMPGPIECNGFVIMGDSDERQELCVQAMSTTDIAKVISTNDVMIAAGLLAKAMKEADEIVKKAKAEKSFKELFNL